MSNEEKLKKVSIEEDKCKYINIDIYLEKELDRIKLDIWLNEEFQYHPHKIRKQIFDNVKKILFDP